MSVAVQGIFSKATTTIDGGWNITFSTHQSKEVTEIATLRDESLFVVVMTEAEYYASQEQRKNSDG